MVLGYHREPWICIKSIAEGDAERRSKETNELYVAMSIHEYEEKFTDKELDTFTEEVVRKAKELLEAGNQLKPVVPSYQLYSTGKHLLGEYNNKVIVINLEELSVCKVITDQNIISQIKKYTQEVDEMYNRLRPACYLRERELCDRRAEYVSQLLEELISSAT